MQQILTDIRSSILIVEDERLVAKDLQQTLESMGYNAYAIASSSEEALQLASERCPHLVLMDIRIKGERDGIETAEILHSRFDVPVVYLTAHADEGTVERAKASDPYGYLLKPVKSAELRSVIEVSLHRHEMDRQLRYQQRWVSTTLETLADVVVVCDVEGIVSMLNPAAEQLLGVDSTSAVGKPADDLLHLRVRGELVTPFADVLRTRNPVQLHEAILVTAHGERVISDSVSPILNGRDMLGAVMVVRDITGEKLLQERLAQASRMASLGTMAAGVAHEMNNPLSIISANVSYVRDRVDRVLQTLQQGQFPDEVQLRSLERALEAQDEIERAATRTANVVTDLRSYTRPGDEAENQANIAATVQSSVKATSREFIDRARVDNQLVSQGDLPLVAIEPSRLEQVLVNLLINAAHAISPGHKEQNQVTISLGDSEAGTLGVLVEDTGPGIPSEVQARIFDPFFTTKKVDQGTGLGLSICHGIIASAGGEIQVDSELGQGTTIRIVLPTVARRSSQRATPIEGQEERKGRLIVIDDDEGVLSATARALESHDIECFASATDALERLRQDEQVDVILCDLKMPEMSGAEFYRILSGEIPDLAERIVFLTGGSTGEHESSFLANCSAPCMEKPFNPKQLRQLVQSLLRS